MSRPNSLVERFDWMLQHLREGASLNEGYLAAFVSGYRLALAEADKACAAGGRVTADARSAWLEECLHLEECAHIADNVAAQSSYVDGDRIYRNGWKAAAEKIAELVRQNKGKAS